MRSFGYGIAKVMEPEQGGYVVISGKGSSEIFALTGTIRKTEVDRDDAVLYRLKSEIRGSNMVGRNYGRDGACVRVEVLGATRNCMNSVR